MKNIAIFIISLYQALFPFRGNCRFYHTCSNYTKAAIEQHGVIRGVFLGAKRIIKCNPFSSYGTFVE